MACTGKEKPMSNISCIIPAFNEEENLRHTLRAVTGISSLLKEIIVIDDGSTDRTADIVREFSSVHVYTQPNQGKTQAVTNGIEKSTGDYILLLDADLKGITSRAIKNLIQPILDNSAQVSMSMRENTPYWMKMISLDFMSGERLFPKEMVIGKLDEMKKMKSFGLEVYLNQLILERNYKVTSVLLNGVFNNFKWNKRGLWKGIKDELSMWKDIFSVVSPIRLVKDVFYLSKLVHEKQK